MRSKTGAIVLIVLGTILLLSNLGLISGLGAIIVRWWPVILIVVGVNLLMRKS